MTAASDWATVVAMACETEDRTPAEQKALERTADRLDRDRNRFTSSNRRYAHGAVRVPCTAPGHSDTEKCSVCSMASDPCCRLLVPPFTESAKSEPLTDEHGWSRAGEAVRGLWPIFGTCDPTGGASVALDGSERAQTGRATA